MTAAKQFCCPSLVSGVSAFCDVRNGSSWVGDRRNWSRWCPTVSPKKAEIPQNQLTCIATEMEAEKETANADNNGPIPVSKKKPTEEHMLLREAMENTLMWEKAMEAKHSEGQAGEILDRVCQYMREPEFPKEPFHNWSEDLMNDAKNGWRTRVVRQVSSTKYGTRVLRGDRSAWVPSTFYRRQRI